MAVRRVSPRVHIPALRAGAQTRVVAAPCRLRPRTGGRGATGGLLWAADAQPEGTGGTQDNPWDTCCPLLGHSRTSLFRANDINQYRIFVLSWPGVNVIKLRVPGKQGENVAFINLCLSFILFSHDFVFGRLFTHGKGSHHIRKTVKKSGQCPYRGGGATPVHSF